MITSQQSAKRIASGMFQSIGRAGAVAFLLVLGWLLTAGSGLARADDAAAAPPNAFTKKTAADPKRAETTSAKPGAAEPAANADGQRKTGNVGQNEEFSFQQSKVAAEMTELEQRMFRLSEALKKIEPENSSRLMSGVKYARNELILHEMQEIKEILLKADYNTAGSRQKELLAKLERLEQLLLSNDADLQAQLQQLRLLRDILGRLDRAIKEEDRQQKLSANAAKKDAETLNQEQYNGMRREQEQNHSASDKIGDMLRELGDPGAGALGELTRATGSMSSAEQQLGQRQAEPAAKSQAEALASLKYAREQLAQQELRLLNQIRAEVKKRVLEGITLMIERQAAVRQSTERLVPRTKEGSRQALTSVVALSKSEEEIMNIGNELIALVEETEFGIVLPAALRSIMDEMDDVKNQLAAGEATDEVVEAERQIEADLKALLEAMKRLPSSASSGLRPGNLDDQERELNRLIAELKMVRILQVRINHDTKRTDANRAAELTSLSAEMQRKIQSIHDRQQDVHDVTDKLNMQRGTDLP